MRLLGQFSFTKRFYMNKKHKKHKKAQRRKQVKAQNATIEQKFKNTLKKHLRRKKSPILLLRFGVFCASEEKKIGKREKSPQCKCTKYQCPHNQVNVLRLISTLT